MVHHFFGLLVQGKSGILIKLIVKLPKTPIQYLHYEKIEWFTNGLAIEFLSCNNHMQLIVFLCHERHQMNCISCTGCNSLYVQPYVYATHATLLQLHKNNLCNYNATTMQLLFTTSCWCCISSIHDHELCSFLLQLFCTLLSQYFI